MSINSTEHLAVAGSDGEGYTAERMQCNQPTATVLRWTRTHIAIKVPGHTFWLSQIEPQAYASPEIQVFEVSESYIDDQGLYRLEAQLLVGFDVGRNSPPVLSPKSIKKEGA